MTEIVEKMFEDARRHHQAGNLVDAERICRHAAQIGENTTEIDFYFLSQPDMENEAGIVIGA